MLSEHIFSPAPDIFQGIQLFLPDRLFHRFFPRALDRLFRHIRPGHHSFHPRCLSSRSDVVHPTSYHSRSARDVQRHRYLPYRNFLLIFRLCPRRSAHRARPHAPTDCPVPRTTTTLGRCCRLLGHVSPRSPAPCAPHQVQCGNTAHTSRERDQFTRA